jgi:hypothetical protein
MRATGTGGAIASAAVDPPMSPDFDLQDGGIVGAREGGKRLSAVGTSLRFGGQFDDLFDSGQVGVVATFGSRLSPLLSAGSRRSGRAGGAVAGGGRIGLATEELLFEATDAGVELLVLLAEEFLPSDGSVMQGLPIVLQRKKLFDSPRLVAILEART